MTDVTPPAPPAPAPVPEPSVEGEGRARHAAAPSASVLQRRRLMVVGGVLVVVAVIVVIVVLVTGGGGGGTPTGFSAANPGQSSKVTGANGKALSEISTYRAAVQGCGSQTTCIEKADRTLGDQLHLYANYVGTLKQAGGASKVVSNALNTAQVTANTFEILGDAQPTAANYRQVLHNFNVQSQLDKLTSAINALGAAASA